MPSILGNDYSTQYAHILQRPTFGCRDYPPLRPSFVTYKLSCRDLMEMMEERGNELAQQFCKEKRRLKLPGVGTYTTKNPWMPLFAA